MAPRQCKTISFPSRHSARGGKTRHTAIGHSARIAERDKSFIPTAIYYHPTLQLSGDTIT
eukprot:1191430-Amphidinium_carterae.2